MTTRRQHYVTAADAAKLLGKSERTVRRWIDEGKIKARQIAMRLPLMTWRRW